MSSLMQFQGEISSRGVHLMAYLVKDDNGHLIDIEVEPCPSCGREHPVLYTFIRKPRGMLGCCVKFQYNGESHVPDLSIPLHLERLPRDAVRMDAAKSRDYWHS